MVETFLGDVSGAGLDRLSWKVVISKVLEITSDFSASHCSEAEGVILKKNIFFCLIVLDQRNGENLKRFGTFIDRRIMKFGDDFYEQIEGGYESRADECSSNMK